MKRLLIFALGLVLAGAIILAGCSSGSSNTTSSPATVAVTLSDPTTCGKGSLGNVTFDHVFVTVTDVQINASSSAGDTDPNWIDLTPNLKSTPQTIDLMSQASAQCFLATLGSTTNLPPGTYQQVRVILASSGNNSSCGSAGPNCAVPTGTTTPLPLLLSSQAQTGLKIPSGQIAGGQFTVAAGQNKTLNIDIDGCASIVMQGNNQLRLKPVLHAGEVNTTSNAIDGTVVDKTTGKPIPNAKGIAVLEVKDSAGIDRKFRQTTIDPTTGHFSFCPVDAGTYDVVLVVVNGTTNDSYPAAIITGATPGSGLGTIQLSVVSGTPTSQGTVAGSVSTQSGATPPAAIAEDVTLSVLATAGSGTFTIPLPLATPVASTTVNVTTATGGTCGAGTDCATYTVSVPGAIPTLAAFTSGQAVNFTSGGTVPGSYKIEGAANCSAPVTTATAVSVAPGASNVPAPAIALTGCQ